MYVVSFFSLVMH